MLEKTLLKIALICSLAGILILFYIEDSVIIAESQISQLEKDKTSLIIGKVNSFYQNENMSVLTIAKTEYITIFVFENISLQNGQTVEVLGKTTEYKGKKEIIADLIKVLEK